MDAPRLRELLDRIKGTSVAVLGDFCIDAYWQIDESLAEISIESGKRTMPVRIQRYSMGGAGNIVANLVDIGVGGVYAIGVLGDDLFGREMIRLMEALGVDTAGMLTQQENWSTPVYGKPYVGQEELRRIDFGVHNVIGEETGTRVLDVLREVLPRVQTVVVNQQLPRGINSDRVIEGINAVIAANPPKIFIVDSRDRSERYRGVMYRMNAHEASRLCGKELPLDQPIGMEDSKSLARTISDKSGKPVFVSRGPLGSVVHYAGETTELYGIQTLKATDTVGAGDTSISALAGALAAGATPLEAAELANFAAAVTVQKICTTGTASPEEIIEIGSSPDYIYRPELASDPRAARYVEGTEIEIVADVARTAEIRHAIFDNDGTVSTLRQGWEPIMEETFLRAILGESYATAEEGVYSRVVQRVRQYIQRSTGIETIRQMQALADMVNELGYVPDDDILDAYGYKKLYLEELMKTVNSRLEKLDRNELDVSDFSVKGALVMLEELRRRGVKLYLASGTDHEDVVREASKLGYAELFNGGIFGASGRIDRDVKKEVVNRILTENDLAGAGLVCFGDGPVELRETKKRGGVAVGVASDEVRRYGLNLAKRARLIRAGADLVVPDFGQAQVLLGRLFG